MYHKVIFLLFICLLSCATKQSIATSGTFDFTIKVLNPNSRSSNLAAKELKSYLDRISKDFKFENQTFIIGSPNESGLKDILNHDFTDGSYLIRTVKKITYLIGDDRNFVPVAPYAVDRSDVASSNAKLDRLSRSYWDNPFNSLFKSYNSIYNIWEQDGRGTLNAVYGYLEACGFRWYMPGAIGEFYTKSGTEVPTLNNLFTPSIRIRNLGFYGKRFFQCTKDDLFWILRLKLNPGYSDYGNTALGHGIMYLHGRDEIKNNHPEVYGKYNGSRDNSSRDIGKPCLSSKILFEENVKFCRFMFDHYNEPSISVMPPDAYNDMCNCGLCIAASNRLHDEPNSISNYVWNYVNNVAKEVYKTHPSKFITCFAYGNYLIPPSKIEKLSPNIKIGITRNKLEPKNNNADIIEKWKSKTGNKFLFWDYYLYNQPDGHLSKRFHNFVRKIGNDLRNYSPIINGEFLEVYRGSDDSDLLFNHLNIYATANLYWDSSLENENEISARYMQDVFNNDKKILDFYTSLAIDDINYLNSYDAMEKLQKLVNESEIKKHSKLGKQLVENISNNLNKIKENLGANSRPNTDAVNLRAIRRNGASAIIDGNYSNDRYWNDLFEYKFGDGSDMVYFKTTWFDNTLKIGFRVNSKVVNKNEKVVFKFEPFYQNTYTFEFYRDSSLKSFDKNGNLFSLKNINYKTSGVSNGWEGEFVIPLSRDESESIKNEKIYALESGILSPWFANLYYSNTSKVLQYYGNVGNPSTDEYVRFYIR